MSEPSATYRDPMSSAAVRQLVLLGVAGTAGFIALMVADTYSPEEQQIFTDGLGALERECSEATGQSFVSATPAQRLSVLDRLDREQYDYMQAREDEEPVHYFRMIKELALVGYFTSEIGYREAMRFAETPGRFEPCVPYAPGDKAWARHA